MSKRYEVVIYEVMKKTVEIECDTEEEAIEAASEGEGVDLDDGEWDHTITEGKYKPVAKCTCEDIEKEEEENEVKEEEEILESEENTAKEDK